MMKKRLGPFLTMSKSMIVFIGEVKMTTKVNIERKILTIFILLFWG